MKATIRAAFERKLYDWANAQIPKVPIAFENVSFSQSTGLYLRCFVLPAETVDNTLTGQLQEYTGLFQINVVCPAGSGPAAAETVAASIAAQFPAKSRLAHNGKTVMVATPMRERPALQDASTYTIPMDCQYRATS